MKILCSILLLILLVDTCFSQDTTARVIYINKIPPEGILLDNGWKFHAGDNPDYAKSDFNDKDWQSINPTLDIRDSLPEIPKSGICWLRMHLLIDSNVLKKQLALIINQAVASEIYLNGRLLYRFGTVSTYPKEIKAYNPRKPFSFALDKDGQQVFAVRCAIQPNLLYTTLFTHTNPLFYIEINEIDTSFEQYRYERGLATSIIFRVGAFLIFAILHLAFFLYYPLQKANLYFCLYALLEVSADLLQINLPHEVKYIFYFSNVSLDLFQLSTFLLLTALYSLLEQKKKWIYWTLLGLIIAGIFQNALSYSPRESMSVFLISNLVNIEIVRIAFKALKLKKKGAWIIISGATSFSIFWIAFVLGLIFFSYLGQPISSNYTSGDLIFNLASLSVPVATSIYLGLDFAFTNISLKQRLVEIKKLSEENIKAAEEKNALALQMAALETKALRSQMNPHFIFNALNAIKKFLLKNDTANADKYLSSFAKLQRLVLDNTRESKVVLENEIKLLELYLRLEHLRFEDRLTYSIYVDEKINPAETEIPSMLIQPFIENSIVHGLQHKAGKGEVKISFCQEGWLDKDHY